MEETCQSNTLDWSSLVKVSDFSRKPFCFRSVSSYYYSLFFILYSLRFPTLVGNLSVFVLSFLIILYSLFFILYFSSLFSTSVSIHNFVNFLPIGFKFSEYDQYGQMILTIKFHQNRPRGWDRAWSWNLVTL